ncbi:MAG: OB-fold nucleic acid binding domain-containing protein, partial [Bacteroidales bacterium]|nr:OB-fold nucleic acid binding domain-containing protein [Bacteroidales bacterium]
MAELNSQEQNRRQSLQEIRNMGINPYPAAKYPVNAYAADAVAHFDEKPESYQGVCFAGRIMARRIMGKASFGEIMDSTGRIQIYVNRDEL